LEKPDLIDKMIKNHNSRKDYSSIKIDDTITPADKAGNLLKGMSETRTFSLKESIEQINDQIKERMHLHGDILLTVEELKLSINNMMPDVNQHNPEFSKPMMEFKKKLVEVEQMKIEEKLNCSRDIADLKKEQRELIREFTEKEKRATFLGDILTE